MPRFFMAGTEICGDTALIRGRDAEHIRVLRLRPGEKMILCDGNGTDYVCRLVHADKELAEAEVLEIVPCAAEPGVIASVLCGLPKGDKTDLIIQKSVETGASEIVFFYSARCIVKPDFAEKKLERWQRIAEEAAKQSGRGIIPPVRLLPDFKQALDLAARTELPILMYEAGEREAFSSALKDADKIKTAAIITGPEGGFEPSEVDMARQRGIHICSMGKRILRCETAPVVALGALMYAGGDLD